MQYFILQSVILLTIAFFAGAAFGCFLRELRKPTKPKPTEPASDTPQSAVDETEAEPGPVISAAHGYVDMTRNIIEYPWAKEGAAVLAGITTTEVTSTASLQPSPQSAPVSEPLPLVEHKEEQDEPEEIRRDDIKLINGINAQMETRLNQQGIYRHEQIANWTPADIKRVSSEPGFSGNIDSERWVEQAKILVSGGTMKMVETIIHDIPEQEKAQIVSLQDEKTTQTNPSARLQPIQTKQMPGKRRRIYSGAQNTTLHHWEDEDIFLQEFSKLSKPVVKKEPARRSPNQETERDDLKKIKEISAVLEKKLNAIGINRYEQIAEMSSAELNEVSKKLNISSNNNPEKMMLQAKTLLEKA